MWLILSQMASFEISWRVKFMAYKPSKCGLFSKSVWLIWLRLLIVWLIWLSLLIVWLTSSNLAYFLQNVGVFVKNFCLRQPFIKQFRLPEPIYKSESGNLNTCGVLLNGPLNLIWVLNSIFTLYCGLNYGLFWLITALLFLAYFGLF